MFEHPIRYIHELNTILGDGIIGSNLGKWSVWKGKEYSHEDLIEYLEEGNSLIQLSFKAMEDVNKTISIEGKKITFKTYAYNLVKAFQIYDDQLKVIESNDDLKTQIIDEYQKRYEKSDKIH